MSLIKKSLSWVVEVEEKHIEEVEIGIDLERLAAVAANCSDDSDGYQITKSKNLRWLLIFHEVFWTEIRMGMDISS